MRLPPVKFLVVLMAIALFAAWNHFRSEDQRQLLLAEGFSVTQELESSPPLLISENRQQLAVLYPGGYARADFADVASVNASSQLNKQQEKMNFHLVIILNNADATEWRVSFQDEDQLADAERTLNHLIPR